MGRNSNFKDTGSWFPHKEFSCKSTIFSTWLNKQVSFLGENNQYHTNKLGTMLFSINCQEERFWWELRRRLSPLKQTTLWATCRKRWLVVDWVFWLVQDMLLSRVTPILAAEQRNINVQLYWSWFCPDSAWEIRVYCVRCIRYDAARIAEWRWRHAFNKYAIKVVNRVWILSSEQGLMLIIC